LKEDDVYCPICKKSFSHFKSINIPPKSPHFGELACFGCGQSIRLRILYLYLQNNLFKTNKNMNVLHFAPEKSLYDEFKKIDIKKYDLSCY